MPAEKMNLFDKLWSILILVASRLGGFDRLREIAAISVVVLTGSAALGTGKAFSKGRKAAGAV